MPSSKSRKPAARFALIRDRKIDLCFAEELAQEVGRDRLVFAVDSRGGKVTISGWKEATQISPLEMMEALEPWCAAFLYTHVETEGLMRGIPLDVVSRLRKGTTRQLIVAGGITSTVEVDQLNSMGVDAVVGMAIYTGKLNA